MQCVCVHSHTHTRQLLLFQTVTTLGLFNGGARFIVREGLNFYTLFRLSLVLKFMKIRKMMRNIHITILPAV
jgi:hypothetical protein